ncbi:hypothetical protein DAY19_08460 [Halobacteriovorax vibrionivorans]|uniref:Guanylate cyclase domain-containing protein n=1 Tax=Halobacteriovorax vibrionivorans TaxID=2152716 RepID=A0ABY0IFI0_9BACT|nr:MULTISPECIES: hypothetical protein [Halobacteriovorax]RZF21711.1 hypothetical protein DAY19_08460 [Halobacteriovorax vibrionivorans]TGD46166.1 hypothetical protein EP118_13130 [Halobacteriovorax sp. Y22]
MDSTNNNHFVCFIDILGFENLINNDNKDKLKKYTEIFSNLRQYWNSETNEKSTLNLQFFGFSDSLVISVKANSDPSKNISIFKNFCSAISQFQLDLAIHDIWLRGGISYGDFDIIPVNSNNEQDGIIAFGRSLIKAYKQELKFAKFPRIIIDGTVLKPCGEVDRTTFIDNVNRGGHNGTLNNVIFKWKTSSFFTEESHRIASDVYLFIDYMSSIDTKSTQEIDKVIENLQNNLKVPDFFDKYQWVINYFITTLSIKRSSGRLDVQRANELIKRLISI